MSGLVLPDLNQVPIAADSFLGRALISGRQYGRLPEYLEDALRAYLRAQSLAFAQRYRTGIAVARDRLERGLRQAFVCVDLGLEQGAAGDLNLAVELLAGGDLEALRRRGWEEALVRLDRMRTQARAWQGCRDILFLREYQGQLSRWSQLVPETWTSRDPEGEEILLDPRQEYRCFLELESRLVLPRSRPAGPLEALFSEVP